MENMQTSKSVKRNGEDVYKRANWYLNTLLKIKKHVSNHIPINKLYSLSN